VRVGQGLRVSGPKHSPGGVQNPDDVLDAVGPQLRDGGQERFELPRLAARNAAASGQQVPGCGAGEGGGHQLL
jgi:hypothetical protein